MIFDIHEFWNPMVVAINQRDILVLKGTNIGCANTNGGSCKEREFSVIHFYCCVNINWKEGEQVLDSKPACSKNQQLKCLE